MGNVELQDLVAEISARRCFRRQTVELLMFVGVLIIVALAVAHFATRRPPPASRNRHSWITVTNGDSQMRVSLLSEEPNIRLFENFLTRADAQELIRLYRPLLARSTVMKDNDGRARSSDRTSSTAFLPAGDGERNRLLLDIERKVVLISGIPLPNWETLQLTHYSPNQEYKPHLDWFPESDNNRAATIFVYLNSVNYEGSTEFTRIGLSVQPKEGNAVMWFNCTASGNSVVCDVNTEHAGRPPLEGEKFGLNCWARTRRFR